MFGPLADFDFVSVWECCAKGAVSAYKTGWEPQTGVFALRRSARALMVQWVRTFYKAETHYERFTSSDQQALLDTLRKKQTYSFFPMPATFNFRPYTMPYATGVGRHLHEGVVVSHPSHFQLRGKREDDWNHSAFVKQTAARFASAITN